MRAKRSFRTNSASQNVRAKKALGQNFLTSASVAKKLVDSANIARDDIVVEVGPGKGIITHFLLEKTNRVIAVEKDERMVEYLKEKFSQELLSKKLTLVLADILNFNPNAYGLGSNAYKLIGAIPYYITGVFLRKFLSIEKQPNTIALIIQKEVASRICGSSRAKSRNKESILSISVKAYGTPQYVEKVPRKLFSPEPNVDSAIICIKNISKTFFADFGEEDFFKLIKAGFGSKRKKLANNIKTIPKQKVERALQEIGLSINVRAEDVTLSDWKKLYYTLYTK